MWSTLPQALAKGQTGKRVLWCWFIKPSLRDELVGVFKIFLHSGCNLGVSHNDGSCRHQVSTESCVLGMKIKYKACIVNLTFPMQFPWITYIRKLKEGQYTLNSWNKFQVIFTFWSNLPVPAAIGCILKMNGSWWIHIYWGMC